MTTRRKPKLKPRPTKHPADMPSDIDEHVSLFDRFAEWASVISSRPYFFTFCVLLVLVWAPSIFLIHDIDLWQLIINTATTIITFLLVALLQNSERRADQATQHKLNAIAAALAVRLSDDHPDEAAELEAAVGLEHRESTS
jgi:low affinity Fe/Cu permease